MVFYSGIKRMKCHLKKMNETTNIFFKECKPELEKYYIFFTYLQNLNFKYLNKIFIIFHIIEYKIV